MKRAEQPLADKLVYSTETGRISPNQTTPNVIQPSADGIIRLQRESKGRKGKGVTLISGLGGELTEIKTVAAELKKLCGCGGAVKDGIIEIQGDVRDKIKPWLEQRGHKVKFSGG